MHVQYAGSGPRLAEWATSVSAVEVEPYNGQFFVASGLTIVDTPQLSPNAANEMAFAIAAAIERGGGNVGVANAPRLRVRVQECTVTWAGGAGISAVAQVSLRGTISTADGRDVHIAGDGTEGMRASGLILASSAEPMLSLATTSAINELLSSAVDREVEAPAQAPAPTQPPTSAVTVRSGTGFFVSSSGYIATAAHVVENSNSIMAFIGDRSLIATLVARSQSMDLAILKVDATAPAWLPIAPSSVLSLGDPAFTIGFPVGDLVGEQAVYSEGVVSALAGVGGDTSFLQISVPVQPGSSGGPLVLNDGRVVGVITSSAAIEPFIRMTGTLPQSMNWAVRGELLTTVGNWSVPTKSTATSTTKQKAIDRVKRAVVRLVVQ